MVRKLLLVTVALFPATAASAQDKPFNPYAVLSWNPYMGHNLWGASQVIRAQGLAARDHAIAKSINEKTKQEAIVTKQLEVQHTKWMLEYKPYQADFEKRRQEESYRMQMIAAKPMDILTGFALNTLRQRMEKQYSLLEADATPLPELLRNGGLARRINFTDGTVHSSSGLLLHEKINWQGILQEEVFAADRKEVEALLAQARQAAESGSPTWIFQKKLKEHLNRMEGGRVAILQADMKRGSVEMWPQMYAKQQLGQIEQSIGLLGKGNLSETIMMKKNIDAPTIGKLVLLLTERGWQFAGATEGNEAVYTSLYNAMRQAIDRGNFN